MKGREGMGKAKAPQRSPSQQTTFKTYAGYSLIRLPTVNETDLGQVYSELSFLIFLIA